jgi:LysM repeat protein
MNKKTRMLMLIGLLACALILAGCDRPSAVAPLPDTATQTANTQSLADVSAQQTADAAAANNPVQPATPSTAATSPAGTALPPVQPQATDVPAPTALPAQPTSAPAPSTPGPSSPSTSTCGATYIVQPGDRFFSIGRACNVNPYAIAQANNIGAPFLIYPGQQLIIPGGSTSLQPTTTGGNTYVVRPGDNLFRIALMYGKSMQAIAAASGISNYNLIFVGQTLTIP